MPYIPYRNFLPQPTHVTKRSALGPQAHTLPPLPPLPPPSYATDKPSRPNVTRHLTPIQLRNTIKKVASTSQHIDAASWRPSIETKNPEDILMQGPRARALAGRPVDADEGMNRRRQAKCRPKPNAVDNWLCNREGGVLLKYTPGFSCCLPTLCSPFLFIYFLSMLLYRAICIPLYFYVLGYISLGYGFLVLQTTMPLIYLSLFSYAI